MPQPAKKDGDVYITAGVITIIGAAVFKVFNVFTGLTRDPLHPRPREGIGSLLGFFASPMGFVGVILIAVGIIINETNKNKNKNYQNQQ